MRVEELRLNNYVYSGVKMVKVKSIHTESVLKDEVSIYIELNKNLRHYCVSLEDIEPIELTEEILFKCGFKEIRKGVFKLKDWYIDLTSKVWKFKREYQDINFKYLHQLQNLFFVLNGKELEINGL